MKHLEQGLALSKHTYYVTSSSSSSPDPEAFLQTTQWKQRNRDLGIGYETKREFCMGRDDRME